MLNTNSKQLQLRLKSVKLGSDSQEKRLKKLFEPNSVQFEAGIRARVTVERFEIVLGSSFISVLRMVSLSYTKISR